MLSTMIKLPIGNGFIYVHPDIYNQLLKMNITENLQPKHIRTAIQLVHYIIKK